MKDIICEKMHGTQNYFLVVNGLDYPDVKQSDYVEMAKLYCPDGKLKADGVIVVLPPSEESSDFDMLVVNADGSIAEMCGNGIRCFTKFVCDNQLTEKTQFNIGTGVGQRHVWVTDRNEDGRVKNVRVDMGIPKLYDEKTLLIPLENQSAFSLTGRGVSMGNPHFVVPVSDLDDIPVERLGDSIDLALRSDPCFADGVNVEFAAIDKNKPNALKMRVRERGCGETKSCGTGASAVAAVFGDKEDFIQTDVSVLGGQLSFTWTGREHPIYMTGPAVSEAKYTVKLPEKSPQCVMPAHVIKTSERQKS